MELDLDGVVVRRFEDISEKLQDEWSTKNGCERWVVRGKDKDLVSDVSKALMGQHNFVKNVKVLDMHYVIVYD